MKGILILTLFLYSMKAQAELPISWQKTWNGECQSESATGQVNFKFDSELVIEDLGESYRWKIVYNGNDLHQVRNYNLQKTTSPNFYFLNENNGIILRKTYLERTKTLQGLFHVQGNTLLTEYKLVGNSLIVDIRTFRTPTQTGHNVSTFNFSNLQRCVYF